MQMARLLSSHVLKFAPELRVALKPRIIHCHTFIELEPRESSEEGRRAEGSQTRGLQGPNLGFEQASYGWLFLLPFPLSLLLPLPSFPLFFPSSLFPTLPPYSYLYISKYLTKIAFE